MKNYPRADGDTFVLKDCNINTFNSMDFFVDCVFIYNIKHIWLLFINFQEVIWHKSPFGINSDLA